MDIELVVLSVPAFLGMSLIVLRVWKYFDLPLPLNASLFQVEGLFLLPVAGILLGAILLVIIQEPLLFLGVIAVSLVLLGVAYPIAFYFEDIRETIIHRLDSRREENALVRREHRVAMERVNVVPELSDFLIKDVGILAYTDANAEPQLARRGQISSDVNFIRPFVKIHARRRKENHTIELEVHGHHNQQLFHETCDHTLTTPVIASNWLSVKNVPLHNPWQLRIKVDGEWLAIHLFSWSKFRRSMARVRKDGEISQELSRLVANEGLASMSLDELLAEKSQ